MQDRPDSIDLLEPSWTDCVWSLFTKTLSQFIAILAILPS